MSHPIAINAAELQFNKGTKHNFQMCYWIVLHNLYKQMKLQEHQRGEWTAISTGQNTHTISQVDEAQLTPFDWTMDRKH